MYKVSEHISYRLETETATVTRQYRDIPSNIEEFNLTYNNETSGLENVTMGLERYQYHDYDSTTEYPCLEISGTRKMTNKEVAEEKLKRDLEEQNRKAYHKANVEKMINNLSEEEIEEILQHKKRKQ